MEGNDDDEGSNVHLPFELIDECICVDANQSTSQDRFADSYYDPSKHICKPRGSEPMCCDNRCYNRNCLRECNETCFSTCANQKLRKQHFAHIEVRECGGKGKGLFTMQNLSAGDIVGEYKGEVISSKELQMRQSVNKDSRHMYILELVEKKVYLDSTRKGNITRFINHSCDPNCTMEVWTVGSDFRVAIRALKDIQIAVSDDVDEGGGGGVRCAELSFDYAWDPLPGRAPTICLCGAASCRGTIEIQPRSKKMFANDYEASMEEIFPDDESLYRRERELEAFRENFAELRKGVGRWKSCFEPFSFEFAPEKTETAISSDDSDSSNQNTQSYPNLVQFLKNVDNNFLVNKFIKCWWEGNQEYFEAMVLRIHESSVPTSMALGGNGGEGESNEAYLSKDATSVSKIQTHPKYVIRYEADGLETVEDLLDSSNAMSRKHKWYWFDINDKIKSFEKKNDNSGNDDDFIVATVTAAPVNVSNKFNASSVVGVANSNSSIMRASSNSKSSNKKVEVEVEIELVHNFCQTHGNSSNSNSMEKSDAFEFKSYLMKSVPDLQIYFENRNDSKVYHYSISGEESVINKCLLVVKSLIESYRDILKSNSSNSYKRLLELTPATLTGGDWRIVPMKYLSLAATGAKLMLPDTKVGGGNLANWFSLDYFMSKLTNKVLSSTQLNPSSGGGGGGVVLTSAHITNNNLFMEQWLEEMLSHCDSYAIAGLMKPSSAIIQYQSAYERLNLTQSTPGKSISGISASSGNNSTYSGSVGWLKSVEENNKLDLFRAKFLSFLQKIAEKMKLPASSALYSVFLAIRYISITPSKKLLSEDIATNIMGILSIALKSTQKYKPGKLIRQLIINIENIVHGKEIVEDSPAFKYGYNCMLSKEADLLEILKYDLQFMNCANLGTLFCDICNTRSTDKLPFTSLTYSSINKILQSVYHDYHMHKIIISSCNNKNVDSYELLTSILIAFPDISLVFPSELLLLSSAMTTLLIQYFFYYHKLIPLASGSRTGSTGSQQAFGGVSSYKSLSNHATMLKNDKYNESSNNNFFSLFIYLLDVSKNQYNIRSTMLISFVCNFLVLIFANEGSYSLVRELDWVKTNRIFDDWEDRHEISAFLHGVLYIWGKRHKELIGGAAGSVADKLSTSGGKSINSNISSSGGSGESMEVDGNTSRNNSNINSKLGKIDEGTSLQGTTMTPSKSLLKCRLPLIEGFLSMDADKKDVETVVKFNPDEVISSTSDEMGLIVLKKSSLSVNLQLRCANALEAGNLSVSSGKLVHGLCGDSVVFSAKSILSAKQRQFEEKKVRHSLSACGADSSPTSEYHNIGLSWNAVHEMTILSSLHSGYYATGGHCPYFTQVVAMGRFVSASSGESVSGVGGVGGGGFGRSSLGRSGSNSAINSSFKSGGSSGSSNSINSSSTIISDEGSKQHILSIKSLSKYLGNRSTIIEGQEYYTQLLSDLIQSSKNSSIQQKITSFNTSSLDVSQKSSQLSTLPTHYLTIPVVSTLQNVVNVLSSSNNSTKSASSSFSSLDKSLQLAWVRDLFSAVLHLNSRGYYIKWASPDYVTVSSSGVLILSDLSGVVSSGDSANQLLQLVTSGSSDSSSGKSESKSHWFPCIQTTSPEVLVGGVPTLSSSLYTAAALSVLVLSGRYLTKEVSLEKDKERDKESSEGINPMVGAHLLKLFESIGTPRGVRLEAPSLNYFTASAYNLKVKLKDGTDSEARCRLAKILPSIIPSAIYESCSQLPSESTSTSNATTMTSQNGTETSTASDSNSNNPLFVLLSNCLSLNPQNRIIDNGIKYFEKFKCFDCGDLLLQRATNARIANMKVLSEMMRKYDKVKYLERAEKMSRRNRRNEESSSSSAAVKSQFNTSGSTGMQTDFDDNDLDLDFGDDVAKVAADASTGQEALSTDEIADQMYLYSRVLDDYLISTNLLRLDDRATPSSRDAAVIYSNNSSNVSVSVDISSSNNNFSNNNLNRSGSSDNRDIVKDSSRDYDRDRDRRESSRDRRDRDRERDYDRDYDRRDRDSDRRASGSSTNKRLYESDRSDNVDHQYRSSNSNSNSNSNSIRSSSNSSSLDDDRSRDDSQKRPRGDGRQQSRY